MPPSFDDLSGIGAEVVSAMTVLKALSPRSSVVSWRDSAGQYVNFLVSTETIPAEGLEVSGPSKAGHPT